MQIVIDNAKNCAIEKEQSKSIKRLSFSENWNAVEWAPKFCVLLAGRLHFKNVETSLFDEFS